MSAMASRNSPPSPPPPLSPPHHPSPSPPPSPPPSPGQPPAPRTEDKSSVSSEATAGLPEKVPVDEPPFPLIPGPLAPTVEVDKSSSPPGPLQPPTTVEDKSTLGTQGASGFTAGDTSFVTPEANPQVPPSSSRTL